MSTEILLITDRSSSMNSIMPKALEAVNGYIESQKNGPDRCYLTAWSFGYSHDITKDIDHMNINQVEKISLRAYGNTALYDTIGKAVLELDAKLKKWKKKRNVTVIIQTDGMNNDSRKYDLNSIRNLLKTYSEKGWDFVFLGANFMEKVGTDMGIKNESIANFSQTQEGYGMTYKTLSTETITKRSANVAGQEYFIRMR